MARSTSPDGPGPSSARKKRKLNSISGTGDSAGSGSSRQPAAKKRRSQAKGKEKEKTEADWPEYFQKLFKIFKALNTVLAFCSSRKHIAATFPVVRKSVEGLLKEPLDLAKVAELTALLPDMIKFAYEAKNNIRINATQTQHREPSPDFGKFQQEGMYGTQVHEEEHVLILEFAENSKGKKTPVNQTFTLPPALTPAAVKKLVEKRNERFIEAVNNLIQSTSDDEDPAVLLQEAARDCIPINPSSQPLVAFSNTTGKELDMIPDSTHRPSISETIENIKEEEWYKDQITWTRTFPSREGQLALLEHPLPRAIRQAFKESRNITSLYTHQVAAIDALARNSDVIVSTSTASGKSVIYQAPVLRFLRDDKAATAIFIYPTKALAQDQKAALKQLLGVCPGLEGIQVATYDGDTSQEDRPTIRENASIIFTNPDTIHASILPHEDLWRRFLKNLKLVAVDELHYYHDLFGSHVAMVMRRLRRICAAVGNRHVRSISCSATIGNPIVHMKKIFGLDDVEAVTEDGAPSGRKDFLIWNPPWIDPSDPKFGKHSPITEATGLMRYLMKRGIRVILFCKIRKVCELAMKAIRTDLSAEGRHDVLDRVMAYRGGYSQEDRRKIEHEAFSGNLLGIVATNALELGVDIGVLDAVIMLGFPFGLASLRQQIGRAGRRARDALAVLVLDDTPIDQHYLHNPNELFDRPMDDLVVDLDNKFIVESHLQCAAHEMPMTLEDEKWFGPLTKEICETKLVKDRDGWYHTNSKFLPYPAKHVSLRGAEEEAYSVIDVSNLKKGGSAQILEEIEVSRALFELYEGAIFIHQGVPFLVKEISHDNMTAKVIRTDANWITSPRDFTDVDAVETHRIKEIKNSPYRAFYGRVDVKTVVFGFFKTRNKVILDVVDVDMPPYERTTMGMWIDIPLPTLAFMKERGINPAEAIHSAEHAFLNRFSLAAELRTECKAAEKEYKAATSQRKRPARLIFYDIFGNTGIAAKAFDHTSEILNDASVAVSTCPCEDGCGNCISSPSCSENNTVASKLGALVVLQALLNVQVNSNSVPYLIDNAHETIIAADTVKAVQGVVIEKDPI
ncbi:DEAD H helicase [Dentipellis sp. KUC8613]|nr:DEAD H helicase [Dentipellis sp. KUC8613]